MILLSAKSKITRAFCAISSSSARTFSSSGSTTAADRVIGLRADGRRKRISSVGEPKIFRLAMLSAFAIAAVGLPTRASGDPGKRSFGLLPLRGELERKDSGRGEEESEYACEEGATRCLGMAKGGVAPLSYACNTGAVVDVRATAFDGPATALSDESGRERKPREGRRARVVSRFGALASSSARALISTVLFSTTT